MLLHRIFQFGGYLELSNPWLDQGQHPLQYTADQAGGLPHAVDLLRILNGPKFLDSSSAVNPAHAASHGGVERRSLVYGKLRWVISQPHAATVPSKSLADRGQ